MANQFQAMHEQMKAWVGEQEAAGWPSPEIEREAKRVLNGLWECASNEVLSPSALTSLADSTAALAKARAKSD